MQRQTDIVALAGDNREDAAVRIGCAVSWLVRAGMSAFFVRTRLNTRLIPIVCKGYFRSGGNPFRQIKKKHFVQSACARDIAKLRLNAPDWP